MRHLLVALIFVTVAVSGCIQVEVGTQTTPTQTQTASQTTTSSTTTAPPPPPEPGTGNIEGFVRDDKGPIAGATIRLTGPEARDTTSDEEGGYAFVDVRPGDYTLRAEDAPNNRSVERGVVVIEDDVAFVFLTLPALLEPEEPAPEPTPPGRFDCPGGEEVLEPFPTFGQGDAGVPSLTWASMKTGFRAVVAWQTAEPVAATLEYSAFGAPYATLSESTPRTAHVFVVDNLPIGKTFCFKVDGAQTHAMRLGNAGNGFDEATGIYTVNLMVLVNEQSDVDDVVAGLDYFAELLWDATDGYIRSGMNIVVVNDFERHNSGWTTCYIPGLSSPTCQFAYDVIFTFDAHPGGAASTYRDGIADPEAAMWMNWYWQANPIITLDNVGAVLTHEMGHYMLGMQDMYAPAQSTNTGDCWDSSTTISIMGGSRSATEFDDEVNRCPNEAEIVEDRGAYEPAWTSMVKRYKEIPQRTGLPDPGPTGHGGVYQALVFDATPV